jgi:hypothetical protein
MEMCRVMPGQRRYDAVVFDLLTALIDSWTLWSRAAGSTEDGLTWWREYLALTYAVGAYRSYEGIVRQAAARIDSEAACAGRLPTSRAPMVSECPCSGTIEWRCSASTPLARTSSRAALSHFSTSSDRRANDVPRLT